MTKLSKNSESANDSLQISASANEKGIQIFNNQEFGNVRVVIKNNEPLFCLSDVCKILEIGNTSQVKARLEDGVISNEVIYDGLGRTQQATFINEDGLYDVIIDSRKPEAKRFRKWVTSEVLPSIRKTGSYSVQNRIEPTTEEAISWITFVGKELGLNDTSKLLLMKQWGDSKGLPTPDYVSSKDVLLSASELLKRNNISVSARVFNVAMIEKGLIERLSRPSKNGNKQFNHLTDKGLVYGENQVSPNNPKETQPLYYESKFSQLLAEIGLR